MSRTTLSNDAAPRLSQSDNERPSSSNESLTETPPVRSGAVRVIDWVITPNDGDWTSLALPISCHDTFTRPSMRDVEDEAEYAEFIRQPCENPVSLRVIHAFNAPWAFEPITAGDDIANHLELDSARGVNVQRFADIASNKPNVNNTSLPPSCSTWDAAYVGVVNADDRLESHQLTRFSADVLVSHPHRDVSGDSSACFIAGQHQFAFRSREGATAPVVTEHDVCRRRIVVYCRHGRRNRKEEGDPRTQAFDPFFTMAIMEFSADHKDAFLSLNIGIGGFHGYFPEESGISLVQDYLGSIVRDITNAWADLISVASHHNANLENHLFARPDDDSRSRDLWQYSKYWIAMDRLLYQWIRVLRRQESQFNKILERAHNELVRDLECAPTYKDGTSWEFLYSVPRHGDSDSGDGSKPESPLVSDAAESQASHSTRRRAKSSDSRSLLPDTVDHARSSSSACEDAPAKPQADVDGQDRPRDYVTESSSRPKTTAQAHPESAQKTKSSTIGSFADIPPPMGQRPASTRTTSYLSGESDSNDTDNRFSEDDASDSLSARGSAWGYSRRRQLKKYGEPHRLKFNEVSFLTMLDELETAAAGIQRDLISSTTNMLDMLYKSVAIRDTRVSLSLNESLWRLSWITFIFLPLTFLSGFFGMNVDWFSNDPSASWYFVSVAGMIVVMAAMWAIVRFRMKKSSRFTPPSYEMV